MPGGMEVRLCKFGISLRMSGAPRPMYLEATPLGPVRGGSHPNVAENCAHKKTRGEGKGKAGQGRKLGGRPQTSWRNEALATMAESQRTI